VGRLLSLVWLLRALIVLGLAAMAYYLSWWAEGGRITSPLLALALVLAAFYQWTQLLGSWAIYAAARKPEEPPAFPHANPSLDVFVTACREPHDLIKTTLEAAVALRGEHRTWLLDDGADYRLAELAGRLGAGYLTRTDRADAKAGNVNAALARTDGEVVVLFDADHVPAPDFLERALGHFADPKVGFVQVMLSFSNEGESWFARAANETCLDFFNSTSIGMDRMGSATMHGSNALVRRTALDSIGGYRPGLAEDLATSLALHARGWKSAYVAEPLAPGLAPPDLSAWFTQQLKWARGVFEVLFASLPRLLPKLTWGQRLCYAVRTTYYLAGPVIAVHMAFTVAVLLAGDRVAQIALQSYLLHLLPLALAGLAIRIVALLCWRHPSVGGLLMWRGTVLVQATWPIYTLAWLMALLRLPLDSRLTPKTRGAGSRSYLLMPQIAAATLLAVAAWLGLSGGKALHIEALLLISVLQIYPQVVLMWQAARTA
jgi:cellulose synthase (UDP-forming)